MASTAPTTPECRASSSPVPHAELQADSSGPVLPDLLQPPSTRLATKLSNGTLPRSLETRRCVRNICCIGAGYVGGPTAAVIAYQNPHIRVTVADLDARRIHRWNSRHLPIFEPGLQPLVRIARDGGRAFAFAAGSDGTDTWDDTSTSSSKGCAAAAETTSVPARAPNLFFSVDVRACVAQADLVFIAVNTPTKASGVGKGCAMDMAAFEAVVGEIALGARAGAIVVEKSTVPCRTAQVVRDMMAVHRPGVHFEILSNPEFLAAGTAVHDLLHPDRILIGSFPTPSGRRAAAALADVYAAWVPRARIITTNVWSSELSKLVANAMLAQRISSINSVAALCEATGADIGEVAASVGSDARIGDRFLKAGIGFGGSCFRKDVLSLVYLAESLGLGDVGAYWRQVVAMNEYQRDRFARRVVRCLNNTLVGKKVTFLGFTFKANTSDVRESPAGEIIRMLLDEKPREIAIFDPCCNPDVVRREMETMSRPRVDAGGGEEWPVVVYSDVYDACAESNAVLITTECDEFRNTKSSVLPFPDHHNPSENFDPRPFARREPSEMDILSLHTFLLQTSPISASGGDPLGRYEEELACTENCPECELGKTSGGKAGQKLDWYRIAYHMKKPRWVFDGKGVIDPEEMAKLDVRVESIGRRGRG
ncbi:nucleotide sugar dehydrogenase [Hypoxylon argillaceum]|nr:nucleotide sugar dehydrogenase [Hypoxylon argillaceum]